MSNVQDEKEQSNQDELIGQLVKFATQYFQEDEHRDARDALMILDAADTAERENPRVVTPSWGWVFSNLLLPRGRSWRDPGFCWHEPGVCIGAARVDVWVFQREKYLAAIREDNLRLALPDEHVDLFLVDLRKCKGQSIVIMCLPKRFMVHYVRVRSISSST